MAKTVLANTEGFTPVIDSLAEELGLMTAVVFGRIWRFCQMEDGVCKASLDTIADGIGIDKATVMRHAKDLCEAGYLKDLTPDLRNRPHVYADTGKASMKISIFGVAQRNVKPESVAERNVTVAQSNVTVAESKLNKDSKRHLKESEIARDFKRMNVSEARRLPTLKLYTDATDFFPGSVVWEYVHNTILANDLTFENIHAAAVEWGARGYKPENVKGILEWAVNGIPAGKNSMVPAVSKPAGDPYAALVDYLEQDVQS